MEEEKDSGDSPDKQMFQGEWECGGCKKAITELPFQPGEDQEIFCKECYLQRKGARRSDRPMVQGDWKCSECGNKIAELPFQPSGDRPLFCRDCYRSQRS